MLGRRSLRKLNGTATPTSKHRQWAVVSLEGDSGHGSGTGASKLVRRLLRRLAPVCKEMRYLVFTFGLPALGEELMLASKNGFKLEEVYDVCGDRTDIWDETLRSDLCLPIQQPDLEEAARQLGLVERSRGEMVLDMRRLLGHSKPIFVPAAVALAMQYEKVQGGGWSKRDARRARRLGSS